MLIYSVGPFSSPTGVEANNMRAKVKLNPERFTFAFFDGFLSDDAYEDFQSDTFEAKYGRSPTVGEKRCAQVHRSALRSFVDTGEQWALILEDDAIPTADFQAFMENFDYLTEDACVLLVGQTRQIQKYQWLRRLCDPLFERKKISGDWIVGCNDAINLRGTVAYIVNNKAANLILSSQCAFLADDYSVWRALGIDVRFISSLVIFEDQNTPSSSGNPKRLRHGDNLNNVFKLIFWGLFMRIPLYFLYRLDIFYTRSRPKRGRP